jgi:hypothetical protein
MLSKVGETPRVPRSASRIVGYANASSSCAVMIDTDAGASSTDSVSRDAAETWRSATSWTSRRSVCVDARTSTTRSTDS